MRIEFDIEHPPRQYRGELAHVIRTLFASTASCQAYGPIADLAALREIRVTRLLQGGYGAADVFEIKLVFPNHEFLQVLKIGPADEISRELKAYNSIVKDTQSAFFTPIRRWTPGVIDPSKRSLGQREALIYTHAQEWSPGTRLKTLEDLSFDAVKRGGQHLKDTIDTLTRLFKGVRAALHGASSHPSQITNLRDYWNMRLGPAAEIETAGTPELINSTVHLNDACIGSNSFPIFPDDIHAADTWRNGTVTIGDHVTICDLTAVWDGDRLIGRFETKYHPHFSVVVVPRDRTALSRMRDAIRNGMVFSVTGTLKCLRNQNVRQAIRDTLNLTFVEGALTSKATTVPDPFAHLCDILEKPRGDLPLSTVHGDLNSRNILIVDKQPCLIDYRHTTSGQPLLADFCWLEVTLARRILPRKLSWEHHILLQRSLSATCRIGKIAMSTFTSSLATCLPALANAYQLFAVIRFSSQDAYPVEDASRWYLDYVSQLAVMAHITLKWAPEHPGETKAAIAIAGVATESTSPQLTQKFWSDADLQTLGAQVIQLHLNDPAKALFDLVATSHSLERFRIPVDDALFQNFVALRSAYIRSNNDLLTNAAKIRDGVDEGHNTYVALKAFIKLKGRISTIPNAPEVPYDEFIQNDTLLNAMEQDRRDAQGKDAIDLSAKGCISTIPSAPEVPYDEFIQNSTLLKALEQDGRDTQGKNAIDLLANCHRVTILGDAGAGKTTLAEEWQFLLSESIRKEEGPTPRLPIVLRAHEVFEMMGDDKWDAPEDTAKVLHFVDRDLLHIGAVHLIVDGLNEVGPESRVTVAAWLKAFKRHFPLLPIAVCHRRYGYSPGLLPSFSVLQLLKLTPKQAKEYTQKYLSTLGASDAEVLASNLLHQLTGNPDLQSIRELAENPMFLWMLVGQYHRDGHLQKSRGALFTDFTRWYLRDCPRGSSNEWTYGYDHKAELLEVLGYDLVEDQRTDLSISRIESLSAIEYPEWKALLAEIAESNILFKERDTYRFLHQSFQEYFAARYFLKRYASDSKEVQKKIRQHNWWDTFVILLGFAESSSDTVLAIIQESLETNPLLTARFLRVCEVVDLEVVEAFASAQKNILLDNNMPSHLHEQSAMALAEYGRGPARDALFRLVADVSLRESVRRTILIKLVEIATQPRFKSEKRELRKRLQECLANIIQDDSSTELRVLAIRSVNTLKLQEMGAILSAILNNSPRAVRLTAWDTCRKLNIALPVSYVRTFQQHCVDMLAEADKELRSKHVTSDIRALNDDRTRILKALATPEHLVLLLRHRFSLGLVDNVRHILDEVVKSDGQPGEEEREAWHILRKSSGDRNDDISEWIVAFRGTDDLVAAAAAHRLCAISGEIPTHELEQLLDVEASTDRLAATAAILDASNNRGIADAMEKFLRRQLKIIKGYDEVCSFTLLALAFVRLARRRGHRLLALANSYLFDHNMAEIALHPLRIMHNIVAIQPEDYEILLAGDRDSAKAAIYNLQRRSPELLICSNNQWPTRLAETARAALVRVVTQETQPRWQGFSARAICECEATELLPWLIETAQNPELAHRVFEMYLPDIGYYAELHRANIIRSIGYLSRIAMDQGDSTNVEQAISYIRHTNEGVTNGMDSRIVNGIASALGFLGEWQPILNALRRGESWMFTAASNVFRYWIPSPPEGTRQRYDAAVWIARRLKETSELEPDVVSALLDVKVDIEKSLEHVIDVDQSGTPFFSLTDIRVSNSRRIRLEQKERQLREAIEANPRDAGAYGNYALFLKNERKDFKGAEMNYRTALELDPSQSNITANFAFFLASVKNSTGEARELYAKALAEKPDPTWIGNYATFLENNLNDVDDAKIHFERALQLAPDDANLLANFAAFLIWQEQIPEAEQLLATAWRKRFAAGLRAVAKLAFLFALIAAIRHQDPSEALSRLKSILEGEFTTHPWPLTRLREWFIKQLGQEQRSLFVALSKAISDERLISDLAEHNQWQLVSAISWKSPWSKMDRLSDPEHDDA